MEEQPTTQLGKYHLLRHLARGGMSDIYLAREDGHEQLYALKLVKPEWVGDFRHFQRETAILQKLKHAHILPLYDFCEEKNGVAYYVTPYIPQGSLKDRLSDGPLSLEEAGEILGQVTDALQFIHDLGLVHRDIKPANILLGAQNHAWLADFGLAKEINTPSDLTASSCLLGTPYYIAPELLEKQATQSSDIYSLGVVLYEMLTGAPPFNGQTPLAICWKHAHELPPLPSTLNLAISPAVEEVILCALEKNPSERFASVHEMFEAYQQALVEPTLVLRRRPDASESQDSSTLAGTGLGQGLSAAAFARWRNLSGRVMLPIQLEQTLTRLKPHWEQVSTLAQQPPKRSLAVAMIVLAMLFFGSMTTLAVAYQFQPSATIKASAQMISLPTVHPTSRPATPTATPKPKPKPVTHKVPVPSSAGNASNSQNAYPPSGHHKHRKGHGDD